MMAGSRESGNMVIYGEVFLEEPRERGMHQGSHARRTKETVAELYSLILQDPHRFREEVDVIEPPSRGFIARAMDTPHFPEWAKQQITDLQVRGLLNPVRLRHIVQEAREDIHDLTELFERDDPDDLIDWDEIKHEFIGPGGAQKESMGRGNTARTLRRY